jgi:hypothetical protein
MTVSTIITTERKLAGRSAREEIAKKEEQVMHLWNLNFGLSDVLAGKAGRRRRRNSGVVVREVGNIFEPLETRRMFSVTAVSSGGILTVTGDAGPNAITVSRDNAGTLLVNNGAVHITGPTATTANTALIEILGQAGNDRLSLDETHGALPRTAPCRRPALTAARATTR